MIDRFPSYKRFSHTINFGVTLVLLGISFVSVWIFGGIPWIAMVFIFIPGFLTLFYLRSRKLFLVYLIFFCVGTLQEVFFISRGAWSYQETSRFLIPAYLPFVWGNISILCVVALKGILMLHSARGLLHEPPGFSVILRTILFSAMFALGGLLLFYQQPTVLIGIFLIIDVFLVFSIRSVPLAIVGLMALFFGAIGDLVSVALGRWSYPPIGTIAGVPGYIFIGWDIVGLIIAGMYLALDASDAPIFIREKNQRIDESSPNHAE